MHIQVDKDVHLNKSITGCKAFRREGETTDWLTFFFYFGLDILHNVPEI
jgi:hypothetical protein